MAGKTPKTLAGGNPQIAKADGDAPVQAYIAAMPGWKRDVGRRLDALVVRTVSDVRKAVKWNSPFYGIEGQGWFLSVHCFTTYVKVAFFRGTSLRPLPPGASKQKDVRYLDIHEDDQLDEELMASWIRQASTYQPRTTRQRICMVLEKCVDETRPSSSMSSVTAMGHSLHVRSDGSTSRIVELATGALKH
jgi:hypothetical protein